MADEEKDVSEAAPGTKPAGKGGLPMPVMLAVTAVGSIAVSIALMMFFVKGMVPKNPTDDAHAEEEIPIEEVVPVEAMFSLPTFRCNLMGGGYLKTTISLELADISAGRLLMAAEKAKAGKGAESKAEAGGHGEAPAEPAPEIAAHAEQSPLMAHMEAFRPRFQDTILDILTHKSLGDVLDEDGKTQVKNEIRIALNKLIDPELGQVRFVYFEEFVTTS